ncbi:MAG: guanylate kinase, partial [Gemmatimonadales bacterium]
MKPVVVVLAAPSGGGKTTIARALLARWPDKYGFSVSATTRAPRPGEREGEAYFFLSRGEFERRRAAGEFLEWAEYAGELYGTLRREVDRLRAAGRHVLLDIEVQGARQVRQRYPPPASRAVFILPPSAAELLRRLEGRRSEAPSERAKRLETAIRELGQAETFDYVVVNDELDTAVATVHRIVEAPNAAAPP